MALILLSVFACYGFMLMCVQVYRRMTRPIESLLPTVVIAVKDASEWIEWLVRRLSLQTFAMGKEVADVLIVDMSASSETGRMAQFLQHTYPFITYVPSSSTRRWEDIAVLLDGRKRREALLLDVTKESDISSALQIMHRFFFS